MPATYLRRDSLDLVSDETARTLTRKLTYAGAGVSREVYILDSDTVLKVTIDSGTGAGDCSTEVEAWENACEDDRQYLAAVVAHGRGWIVQQRVCCVGTFCEDCWEGTRDDWQEAKYEMIHAVNAMGIDDMHSGNYGTVNGKVIAIDYAYTGGFGCDSYRCCVNGSCEGCCALCQDGECCAAHERCCASSFCGECEDTYCEHGECVENAVSRTVVRHNFFAHTEKGWVHITNPLHWRAIPMHFCGKHARAGQRANSALWTARDDVERNAINLRNVEAKMWERAGQLRMFGNVTLVGRPTIDRMLAHCDIRHCCQDRKFYSLCAVCVRRANERIARVAIASNGKGN